MTTRKAQLIAFYLPQFHRIPENDAWWGEGFTDWVNVKKARPLFAGHCQPREPHHDLGYYDPTTPGVLEKQARIAREHGIHGFCFYHYWFDGKLLLEKPLERLLAKPDIDLPFCLCWANEPWTRAWDGKERNVLMPQRYGGKSAWRAHFNYLLPALSDPRAIRVDGKPILLIYRIGNIPQANAMLSYWRQLAIQAGLPGLHLVAMLTGFTDSGDFQNVDIDAACEFHPTYALKPRFTDIFGPGLRIGLHRRAMKKFLPFTRKAITKIGYNTLWKRILSLKKVFPVQYRGGFVAWDNTPRKGHGGMIIEGATPERFGHWLGRQVKRALDDHKQEPLIFLNAWNEWAEGAFLEPDTAWGTQYLEAVKMSLVD